jgi:hypothetical protein
MAQPDKTTVARWAAGLTLGQSKPISDDFDTTSFFSKPPLRIHYAAVFNGATATQIHNLTPYNWICCAQPEDLKGIKTGEELVTLVESHLTDQLKAHLAEPALAKLSEKVTSLPLPDQEDGE